MSCSAAMYGTIALPTDEVHLWSVHYDAVTDDALIGRYVSLLDDDEAARHSRFRFDRDQRSFAVSHALLRTTLAHYAPIAPQAWRFVANRFGRPEPAEAVHCGDLRFNLSHTRGAAIVAVVRSRDVGVDLETRDRTTDYDGLADRYFSPAEAATLRRLPADRRRDAFFQYWTLKESYIKARGMGLSLPLDQFTFHLTDGGIAISFDPRLDDQSDAWQFVSWPLDETFQAAVAVRRGDAPPMRFFTRWTVPLVAAEAPVELTGRL